MQDVFLSRLFVVKIILIFSILMLPQNDVFAQSSNVKPVVKKSNQPNWNNIQKREAGLRAKESWPELEDFFTNLTIQYPKWSYGYSSRGYLKMSQNRLAEARADFENAIKLETSPRYIADFRTAVSTIDEITTKAKLTDEIVALESEMVKNEDWIALEQLYDQYVSKMPNEAWVVANRGFKRLDIGHVDEGLDDLQAALQLNPDSNLRNAIDQTIRDVDAVRASGRQVGSSKGDVYIYQAVELSKENRRDDVDATLSKLEGLRLSSQQEGMVSFINAQLLWSDGKRDEAFALYQNAAQTLPADFFLSETYAKMAEYLAATKKKSESKMLIEKALAIMPDFVWRNIQAGDVYYSAGDYKKAIEYYSNAEQQGGLSEEDIYYYHNLAYSYLRTRDRKNYKTYMRRHIATEEARLAQKLELTAEDQIQLHNIKSSYTYQPKIFSGSFYTSGHYYSNDDYYSGFTAEFKATVRPFGIKSDVYAKLYGTYASRFSGSYYDTWSGGNMLWESQQHLGETLYGGIGYAVYPIRNFNMRLGVQQNFKMGRKTRTETLLAAELYESIGGDWQPFKANWFYASLYSLAEYSISYNDIIYRGEGRVGYGFKGGKMFSITPVVALSAGYSGKTLEKNTRWGCEGGAGIMLRRWFRPKDQYKIPFSSIDLSLQYRLGLTRNRHNAVSLSLYYNF